MSQARAQLYGVKREISVQTLIVMISAAEMFNETLFSFSLDRNFVKTIYDLLPTQSMGNQ